MAKNGKPKLAVYWAASCGGCDIAILNVHEKLLVVDEVYDLALWPCAADFKYEDVRGYPDGYIDVCLFNGAIRTSENEELAHVLRAKSKILVAFGSCAHEGCIPGLSNLTSREATLAAAYTDNPSTENPDHHLPQERTVVPEGEIHLPEFYATVKTLGQTVPVDYTVPGCPPEPPQIWAVLEAVTNALTKGTELPPKGSIVGASQVAVCDECPRQKNVKTIERFYRPYEIVPEPEVCLLEQGIVCMGVATRGGCGALCPRVGMRCEGCYGPLDVEDQGAKMLSAIASVTSVGQPGDPEHELERRIDEVMATLADPAGTFYRFGMAHSLLQRARKDHMGKGAAK